MTVFPQAGQVLMLVAALMSVVMLVLLAFCLYLHRAWSRAAVQAEERAKMLLQELLSPVEQRELVQSGCMVVRSPSVANREYRVPARGGLVYGYESGRPVMSICLQPVERLPLSEVVLIHKLMIEGDEQDYLSRANIQWLRAHSARSPFAAAEWAMPAADWTEELG